MTQTEPLFSDMNYSAMDEDQLYLILTRPGREHRDDFERVRGIPLSDGMRLRFYDCDGDGHGGHDDLIAEATVHYDAHDDKWIAIAPLDQVKHLSDVRDIPEHWANHVDWEAVHRDLTASADRFRNLR